MAAWAPQSIPDQSGRIVIVTGSSSGIGAETAEVLAGAGATIVLAVRSQERGEATRALILSRHPQAQVSVSVVDLADLSSIRRFAAATDSALPRIDCLVNNAGLGMQAKRAVTGDGFERQFATNHLGPFALTGLLLPALLRAAAPRVVAVASIAHRTGRIDFDDLQGERLYKGGKAYNQSKLADILFALELDRRARRSGSTLVSVAAHPGVATTGFVAAIGLPEWQAKIGNFAIGIFGQDAKAGAAPLIYAAAMPDVKGGQYWGPNGFMEVRGSPAPAKFAPQALDQGAAARLWTVSEQLTGISYGALDGGTA